MDLLRPYPDELVGSMLSRASRQLGMPDWRLVPLLTGRNLTSHSTVLTCHAGVAEAFGMTPRSFLEGHTLFPYATAFLQPSERERLLQKLAGGRHSGPVRLAAIAANATKSTAWLRLCSECVNADMRVYGEAYWRRTHQLPGMAICLDHGTSLRESEVELRRGRTTEPPNEAVETQPCRCELSQVLTSQIAKISAAALTGGLTTCPDWQNLYREQLTRLGYALNGRHIFVKVVAKDLSALYGATYLTSVGMEFDHSGQSCWPARMVRPASRNLTPFCHVLFQVFLASSPSPSENLIEHIHQKKAQARDWQVIQNDALREMESELQRLASFGLRPTMERLLREAGIMKFWLGHRDKMPRVVAWLDAFRMSAQSARRATRR